MVVTWHLMFDDNSWILWHTNFNVTRKQMFSVVTNEPFSSSLELAYESQSFGQSTYPYFMTFFYRSKFTRNKWSTATNKRVVSVLALSILAATCIPSTPHFVHIIQSKLWFYEALPHVPPLAVFKLGTSPLTCIQALVMGCQYLLSIHSFCIFNQVSRLC